MQGFYILFANSAGEGGKKRRSSQGSAAAYEKNWEESQNQRRESGQAVPTFAHGILGEGNGGLEQVPVDVQPEGAPLELRQVLGNGEPQA